MHFGYNMDIFLLILVTALHMYPSMTISTNHVRAISTRDYYQNSPSVPVKTNWEIGLKEATYQALIREQIPDPGLKSGIYSAQIQGFQDTATPFGDIAVIARGQLYATPQGYHYVQDPYQNDCDDCHNTPHRCDRRQCELLNSPNLENLLALWTVKRIRHRDPKFGHRYELQFTISPMSPAASPHFVARNGRFDYSIPGHVFIVKLKDNNVAQAQVKNNFRFDKEHKSTNQKEFKVLPWPPNNPDLYNHYSRNQQNNYHNTPNSILLNTGEYFLQKEKTAATTEQHVYNPGFLIGISPNGYKHIIHDIPVLQPPERPYAVPQRHYIPPPPQEPTKEPIKHLHHHFYIPEVEDIDLDKKVTHSTQQPTTQTQKYYKTPTYVITTQNLPETTSPKFVYTPQDTTQSQVSPPLTTDPYFRTTYKYANTDTTIPIFQSESPTYPPRTTLLKVFTIPETSPTQSTSFNPSPFYIHYSEPDPIYSNSQPPTVPTYITQPIVSTLQPTSPTFVTIQDHYTTPTVIDYYDEITHTQATTPTPVTSTTKKGKYPDSINAQLPPPDRGADTTVPYVASTAVTIISTPNSIESTTHPIDKDSSNSESKATTIQENIHTTYEDDEKITTVDIKPRNKFKTTVPYVETTTIIPTITTTTTTTTTTSTTTDTISETPNKNDDDLFAVINVPPRKSNTKNKFTDVDIFGEPKKSTTQSTERITTRTGPSAFDEIFSEFQAQSSTENTNKFLTPHTQLSINVTDALKNARISKYLKYKRNKSNRLSKFRNNTQVTDPTDANGNIETKTSQSLITSISFKVNKNKQENDSTVTPIPLERLTKGEIDEINEKNKTGYNIYEIQRPNTSTEKSQTFDDVAQTLVNHARIVQYLNSKTTKPTRRSYKNTNR